jgi:hypothetical protein
MTSRALSQNAFLDPESSPELSFKDEKLRSRKANVYDAVAGKYFSLVHDQHLITDIQAEYQLQDSFQGT